MKKPIVAAFALLLVLPGFGAAMPPAAAAVFAAQAEAAAGGTEAAAGEASSAWTGEAETTRAGEMEAAWTSAAAAATPPAFAYVSAGRDHNLAVARDGAVWGWGRNASGELGDLSLETHPAPYRIPGLKDVKLAKAGTGFSLALKKDGTVWAWGRPPGLKPAGEAASGAAGSTSSNEPNGPFQIAKSAVSIGVGFRSFGMILMRDGTVWGFGDATDGVLGPSPAASGLTKIKGLPPIAAIAVGGRFVLALDRKGAVWGWGTNTGGPLGPGPDVAETPRRLALADGKPLSRVVALSASERYGLILLKDGSVLSAGTNEFGQRMSEIGLGELAGARYPSKLALPSVRLLSAGVTHALAVRQDGTLWSWGYDDDGRLSPDSYADGDDDEALRGKVSLDPVRIAGIKGKIVQIEASRDRLRSHCLVLTSDGTIWTWGDNDYAYGLGNGELGLGLLGNDFVAKPTPIRKIA